MEEEDFIPNLASMLEVSLVEDSGSDVPYSAKEANQEAETVHDSDDINKNNDDGSVIPSDTEIPPPHTDASDALCPTAVVDQENEVAESSNPESSNADVCNMPYLPPNSLFTADMLGYENPELLESGELLDDVDEEEKHMYYSVFKDLNQVMRMRLHCTVCDCHIGCTSEAVYVMSYHPVLRVLICKDCESFYGSGDFPCGEDDSESFCRWCGQGGQVYCCSNCPTVFCKKCIRRNMGKKGETEIAESSDWTCYRCNTRPLWEHRALCWGLSEFLKEQSKPENKTPEDIAEKTPGFNGMVCCKGEKPAYYRAGQPLRLLHVPLTPGEVQKAREVQQKAKEDRLKAKEEQQKAKEERLKMKEEHKRAYEEQKRALEEKKKAMEEEKKAKEEEKKAKEEQKKMNEMLNKSNEMQIKIKDPRTLNALYTTNVSQELEDITDTETVLVNSIVNTNIPVSNALQSCSVATCVAQTNMNVERIVSSVPEFTMRMSSFQTSAPILPGDGIQNSTVHIYHKEPPATFERAFAQHIVDSSVRIRTPTISPRTILRPNIVSSTVQPRTQSITLPLTLVNVQKQSGGVMRLVPTVSTGVSCPPTVNKVILNSNPGSIIYTVPGTNMSATPSLQPRIGTSLATRYYRVTNGPNDSQKLIPLTNVTVSNPGIQLVQGLQSNILQRSLQNPRTITTTTTAAAAAATTNGNQADVDLCIDVDDNDEIVEVFSNVQNSDDTQKECEWLMRSLKKCDKSAKILAFNVEILRRKLVSGLKGKGSNVKTIRHFSGNLYRLLGKAYKKLSAEKEFVGKEFSDWLNLERMKHDIPNREEKDTANGNVTENGDAGTAEDTQQKESDGLFDMEVSCESDHEEASSPINSPKQDLPSGIKQDLIECSETLSDNDSDSDPFDDVEVQRKNRNPVFKSFYSRTIREILAERYSSKLLLSLLLENDPSLAEKINTQNSVSSTNKPHFNEASTQTDVQKKKDVEEIRESAEEKELSKQRESSEEKKSSEEAEIENTKNNDKESSKETEAQESGLELSNEKITKTTLPTENGFPVIEEVKTIQKSDFIKEAWSCAFTSFLASKESTGPLSPSSTSSSLHLDYDDGDDSTGETGQKTSSERLGKCSQEEEVDISKEDTKVMEGCSSNSVCRNNSSPVLKRKRVDSGKQTNHALSPSSSSSSSESPQAVPKKLRSDSRTSNVSSTSSVRIPVLKLEKLNSDSKSGIVDYTPLINSALQQKLIRPCSVTVTKLNRTQ